MPYADPSDVRLGVDRGDGVLGTLAVPECTPLVPATGEQLYRIVEIRMVPGATFKELVVEKIARPTWIDNR